MEWGCINWLLSSNKYPKITGNLVQFPLLYRPAGEVILGPTEATFDCAGMLSVPALPWADQTSTEGKDWDGLIIPEQLLAASTPNKLRRPCIEACVVSFVDSFISGGWSSIRDSSPLDKQSKLT